jgi:MFS family permease
MTQTAAPAQARAQRPAMLPLFREVLADRPAAAALLALTLAMTAVALQPPYLTLGTTFVQNALRSGTTQLPKYLTAAFLVLAVVTLVGGTTGDLFGRKRILLSGLGLLTISNVVGVFTYSHPAFVIADVLNSVGAVLVLPMCIAIATLEFRPQVRPLAYALLYGTFGIMTGLIAIVAPLVKSSAPLVAFVPELAAGAVALYYVWKSVPESRVAAEVHRVSAILNVLALAGIFALVFVAMVEGAVREHWLGLLAGVMAITLLISLVAWVVRRRRHFQQVTLYTGRDVVLAILAGVALGVGQGAFLYQMPIFFQKAQGTGEVLSIVQLAPFLLGLLAASLVVAQLSLRFDARRILCVGLLLMAAGLFAMSFLKVSTAYFWMILPITVVGLGIGVGSPTRCQVVLAAPPIHLVGAAAAVNQAAGQAGFALGIIGSDVLMTRWAGDALLNALQQNQAPAEVIARIQANLAELLARLFTVDLTTLPPQLAEPIGKVYGAAFTAGLTHTFFFLAALLFVTTVLIALGMRSGLRATAHHEDLPAVPAAPVG